MKIFDHEDLNELYDRLSKCPLMGQIPDDLQSDLRLAFNTARGDYNSGDGGAIIFTQNHGMDLLLAIDAFRNQLEWAKYNFIQK